MATVINDLRSIALSGTAAPVVAIPQDAQMIVVNLGAFYAAVAGTSGLQATFSLSRDGGSTYTLSATPGITLTPAAAALGTGKAVIRIGDDPYRTDAANHPDHLRINLTNLDGTNAVLSVVTTAIETHNP